MLKISKLNGYASLKHKSECTSWFYENEVN